MTMKDKIHQTLSRVHVLTKKGSSLHELKLVAKCITTAKTILASYKTPASSFTQCCSWQYSHSNTAISVYEKTEEAI